MDLNRVVAQLRSDLANINAAIASLEKLQDSERRNKRSPQFMKTKAAATKSLEQADAEKEQSSE
jgi:hypothetical protein